MKEHIRALALIRATMLHDADTVNAILAEGAGPELASSLASFVVAVATETWGPEEGLRAMDHLLRVALEHSS